MNSQTSSPHSGGASHRDDRKRPKKPAWGVIVSLLGGAAVGGGGMMLALWLGEHNRAVRTVFDTLDTLRWLDLMFLPLHFFVVILLHELGHLGGGMARGMRFLLLIVGPLRLRRTVTGIKLDWFLRGDTFGGLAAAMPSKGGGSPRDFLWLVVGGPLVSLLLAAAAFAVVYAADGRLAGHAAILGSMSTAIFLVTAIPMRAGGMLSDGMQALELLRGGTAVEQRNAVMACFAESLSGIRPRDRDPAPLERGLALTGQEPLRDITLWLMAYYVALDRRELEQAGQWLGRVAEAFDAYPSGFRQALACDLAYFHARYRRDLAAATDWYAQAAGGMTEAAARGLTEAAIAWLRGDADTGLAALARAERALGDVGDAGLIPLLQDEMQRLRADLQRSPTHAAATA